MHARGNESGDTQSGANPQAPAGAPKSRSSAGSRITFAAETIVKRRPVRRGSELAVVRDGQLRVR